MKALFIVLLTVLLITGIGGCSRCGDGYYMDIDQMQVTTIHAGWQGIVEENNPVPFDSVIIQASFSGTFYGINTELNSFSFLSSAIASDDCPGLQGSKETIANITIIALSDFDNEFKINDTINNIIEASSFFSSSYLNNEFKDLNQYVAEIQPGIYSDRQGDSGLFLRLKKKPTQNIVKLRVDVGLTNGEKYSAETIPITIKQ